MIFSRFLVSAHEFIECSLQILDAMKDNGIKLVGLDINGHIDGDNRAARDKAWSDAIAKVVKDNPDAKIVAYGGAGHFNRMNDNATNDFLEKDHKINPYVISLIGGDKRPTYTNLKDEEARSSESSTNQVSRMAQLAGQQDRTFLVPLAKGDTVHHDAYIHLARRKENRK